MTDEYARIESELAARGFSRMVFDLSKVEALLDLLGSPQRAYPAIHITGTNGKTSTARIADALLRETGLRTGRYTSPHLLSVRERISLDGEPIDEQRFIDIYREVAPVAEFLDQRGAAESLTYFDMTTAMALATFADAPVDVAVVEVGLGGTDDATNVLQAGICVITPIGLDHTDWLGDTIEEIAQAKAGIIYPGAEVICAQQPAEALAVIERRCADVDAKLLRQGRDFEVVDRRLALGGQLLTIQGRLATYDDIFLPLHGAHQVQNAALALACVESFLAPASGLDPDLVRAGFASASSPGRLERLRNSPTILLDAAHNPHGMAATVHALRDEFDFPRLIVVLAVLADKDSIGMLELLEPIADTLICTRNSSERALDPVELARRAREVVNEDRVVIAATMADAISSAVSLAEDESVGPRAAIVITGSVVTVADARRLLGPARA